MESLRKEIAELHLSNLDNSIDQLETHLANLTHRHAKAQNDKKTYQVTLDFHKANLGTAIERAYEGEISTLDPQPDDTPVITRTKKGIASLLNSVYIWERELRETLQNVMATEEEMDTVSDQLETLQKLREDIAKSL
ncbi:hypothetical protein CDV31_016436 [Fusarium ambrosium]|uniref:Uncharacterized protein n=1 Tax=Fusarium ambrosium TaxID=131363 RepID=A0A428S8N7_9HYPO|nr:hypothetical protein CDV31_016436 [Fusarium ambrosium]